MKYIIIYDYEDCIDCQESFEGSWHELQEEIKLLKKEGCYNIEATALEGGKNMLNKSIEQIAYDKYQLDWMKNHNYSLETLMAELGIYVGRFSDTPLTIEFETWQSDRGFDGTIWVCFKEFLDNEYQDENYMKTLLNEEEFKRYKKRKGEN